QHRGFTLVEMLVVIAVMVALLGLVAAVAPRFNERQRPSKGAGQLQSWLNLAKNRALRDQRPRGLRLPSVTGTTVGTYSFTYIKELQFIELPEVFTGGTLEIPDHNLYGPGLQPPADRYRYVYLSCIVLGERTR